MHTRGGKNGEHSGQETQFAFEDHCIKAPNQESGAGCLSAGYATQIVRIAAHLVRSQR